MNVRTLIQIIFIAVACIAVAGQANAEGSKKKPKEIVVVGSKVKDVVRDAGTTDATSLNPPAIDDRNFRDLTSDTKKSKDDQDDSSSSLGVEREMKESGEKSVPARRPAGIRSKQACDEGLVWSCSGDKTCECSAPPKKVRAKRATRSKQ